MVTFLAIMGWFGKKFKCDACGTKFKSEAELMDHAKSHKMAAENDTGSGLFPCATCMEEFESKGELQDHIKQFH